MTGVPTWLAVIGGAVTVLIGLSALLRLAWRAWRGVSRLVDELLGDPEARPPRPGIAARVAAIEAQTSPNSGKSMHDVVSRIDARTARLDERLDGHLDWHARQGQ